MKARDAARLRRRRFEEAADWVLRHRAGDLNRQAFAAWLEADDENRSAYEAADRLLGEARAAMLSDPALEAMPPKASRKRSPIVPVLLIVALSGGAFLAMGGPLRLEADVVAGADRMPVLTLADGSMMQLNAGSAVAYRFTPGRRVVRLLRGEAFFQVAHDPARPFVVEAAGGTTTARGTAFDVSIGEAATDVAVTEHAVTLAPDGETGQPVRVEAGHGASYDAAGRVGAVRVVDVNAVLAWRRGQLVADDLPLTTVVAAIDRHFAGRVIVTGAARARRVSGTFSVTDTEAALTLLERSLGLTVTRIGPLIIVHG